MGFIDCIFNQNAEENTEENIVCQDNTDKTIDTQPVVPTQSVQIFINDIKKRLRNADSVVISEFGKFYVKEMPEDMKDGQIIKMARKLFFKPYESLKSEANII